MYAAVATASANVNAVSFSANIASIGTLEHARGAKKYIDNQGDVSDAMRQCSEDPTSSLWPSVTAAPAPAVTVTRYGEGGFDAAFPVGVDAIPGRWVSLGAHRDLLNQSVLPQHA